MNRNDSRYYTRDTVHFSEPGYGRAQIKDVSRVTWVGVVVNVALAVVKLLAGIYAKSNVLLADAVHTVSDLATDFAILIGVRYWSAPADANHPHGHRKIETMITLAIGVALAMVGLGLGYEAIRTLADALLNGRDAEAATPKLGTFTALAMLVALASIVSKELLYRWTAAKGVALGSSALVANAWHHRSDAISSIPPLIAMGGEFFGRSFGYDLWYLDPIGTIVVCFMLLQAAWEVMEPTFASLLDASADRQLCSAIRKTVLETKGVIDTHRIRTRVICSHAVAVDLHLIVDQSISVARGHAIANDVKERLLKLQVSSGARPVDVLIYVEPGDPRDRRLPGSDKNTAIDWKYQDGSDTICE